MKRLISTAFLALAALAALAFACYRIMGSRDFQFFGGIVRRAETPEKVIALTFDDGPTERSGAILAALDKAGVKATFFLVGRDMERYPQETASIVRAGHQIANHGYSHVRMVFKPLSFISSEIEKTDALIRTAGYQGQIQFRPPYGKKLLLLPYYLSRHGRATILWDLEPDSIPEVSTGSETIVDYVLEHAKPGSIVLLHAMHDARGVSIGAVKGIAEGLTENGYRFVTVNELLRTDAE